MRTHWWLIVNRLTAHIVMIRAYTTRREARECRKELEDIFGSPSGAGMVVVKVVLKDMIESKPFGQLRYSPTWWISRYEGDENFYFAHHLRCEIPGNLGLHHIEEVRAA